MATRAISPWLGDRRGSLADWATQRWVQWTGTRVRLSEHGWLAGPVGRTRRIGADFFDELAAEHRLEIESGSRLGLMERFDALRGDGFDPDAVAAPIRRFYEVTSEYELDVWSEWSGGFRPFGRLLAIVFSRRLQQLNVPLTSLSTSRGMESRVVRLRDPRTNATPYTGWVRRNPATDETVYVGCYSTDRLPGHHAPCVKVVFPLPNGNALVAMRPVVEEDGSLRLESSGEDFGDPGFYFTVRAPDGDLWVRPLRNFRETIRVYLEGDELHTDHVFRLFGVPCLQLHYRMRERS